MYYKVVNQSDVDQLVHQIQNGEVDELEVWEEEDRTALVKALLELRKLLVILDQCYGEERHPENDLGGFSYVFFSIKDYQEYYDNIIHQRHMEQLPFEYEEVVACGKTVDFVQRVFQLSSDYSLVFLLPKERVEYE